ncbi:ShET2/EspL2 family type III secretion system effector toxin [Candidatus Ichthyocystis sparus]|uniref:ShET2/EspL2 family type III secretion system effector toxin n=2 Tax=Candidatus Ichthyocystis TaxID=2929841 RepID=UPI000B86F0FA|nr:ShET2/EspL2 family type III secretion system effector toxin [Candidatus Ichthyocystis sparus]
MSTVNPGSHVHLSSYSMEVMPSNIRDVPYVSKKYVSDSSNFNRAVEVEGKDISCGPLSLLFVLNSVECYRNNTKLKVSELFSDKDSIKIAALGKLEEIDENIAVKNSCDRNIIACDKFGDFLHRVASNMISGEQRFFMLHSCNHAMSFKVMRNTREIGGSPIDKWVIHFFDPNKTNIVARSEVLIPEEFLDLSKFSLRMFMPKWSYKDYFESKPRLAERECAIYEYSDTREAGFGFSTLETLSQDGISGCMIYHIMLSDIDSLCIREIVRSKSFSTLSGNARREIFFARSSGGVFALYMAMELNKSNSIKSYNDLLGELSKSEQLDLLPEIMKSESIENMTALYIAMRENSFQSIDAFGSLVDRFMNIRSRIGIGTFCQMLFDILLAKSVFFNSSSAISVALSTNSIQAILAYGGILDRLFILKDDISSRKLATMIFELLNYKNRKKDSALFYPLLLGFSGAVLSFGNLMDRLLLMKGHIPDDDMVEMIFNLLRAESDSIPGLFYALKNGRSGAVRAFSKLMDRLLIARGSVSYTSIANMIYKLLSCSDADGASGVFFALQRGFADTVRAFSELVDKLLILRGDYGTDVHNLDDIIYNLLRPSCKGVGGLFFALREGHTDTIFAWGELVGKFFILLNRCNHFDSMALNILWARDMDGGFGIFEPLLKNNVDVIVAYNSLLLHASKRTRRMIFCFKNGDGYPALYALIFHNHPQSLTAYNHFLQALSCDELIDMLPELLISKNDSGDPALLVAMREGYADCISAYGVLMEKQLMKIRDRMSQDDFANLVLDIALAKRSDGMSALFMGMHQNRFGAIEAYSGLLGKVSLLLKGSISDDRFVGVIFELLKARTSEGIDGLFMSLKKGNTDSVLAFGLLLDNFLSMKVYIEDITLFGMAFDLLMCKSDGGIPGLFEAMQNGHHETVGAFVKLLEKLMLFKDDISAGYFNNTLLDLVRSRRSDGVSGLSVALENDFPEVVRSYFTLLRLIPKDKLVDVLLALNASGVPAVLLAGEETLGAYLGMISDLSAEGMYELYSQLSSARRSVEHILTGDRDLGDKYKLLLEKIKELAGISGQDH